MKLTEVKILDKKEYRARLDEINNLVEKQDYREALNVVETIVVGGGCRWNNCSMYP